MSMCTTDEFYTISDLRKKTILCSDGLKFGRVVDIVFDSVMNLHSFIIGGTRWEEFREALGIIDDFDPVLPIGLIQEITDKEIIINAKKEDLKHKLQVGVFPEKSFSYSSLKRKKIFDEQKRRIGKIANLLFVPCGEPAFIIGGNWFEEAGEKIGFKENTDLLLPMAYIKKIDDEGIKLNIQLENLKVTLDNKPLDSESQRHYLNSIHNKKDMQMRILERRKVEEFRDFSRFY
ncbi:MAG TPA: hypothetical protein VMX55_05950 [candidate division Zixibacteria bacterium]|nr:hypothetical protein [candidate division Zixibacteria bacterium]